MINETTILQRENITVTDARFIVGSQTYAIRGVISVKGIEITPNFFARFLGETSTFAIVFRTSGGEGRVFHSKDSDLVSKL